MDLHWHLVNDVRVRRHLAIDTAGLIARRRQIDLGIPIRVHTTGDVDTLVHLAFHAQMSGGDRLVWLKDLDLLVRGQAPDWPAVVDRARSWQVALPVAIVLAKVRQRLATPVPSAALDELATSKTWRAISAASSWLVPPGTTSGEGSVDRIVSRAARADLPTSLGELSRRIRRWSREHTSRPTVAATMAVRRGSPDDYLSRIVPEQSGVTA